VLSIGEDVTLKVRDLAERCLMVDLAQNDLPHDPRILRNVCRDGDPHFGVHAEVLAPGTIEHDDPVVVGGMPRWSTAVP
jgi:hypothetical protein